MISEAVSASVPAAGIECSEDGLSAQVFPRGHRSGRRALLAAALAGPVALLAQSVLPAQAADSSAPTAVHELSPFTVQADRDDSYGAVNSNSLAGFNASLERLPISADVLTSAFMKDTASTAIEDMVGNFSAGAEFRGATGDADGGSNQQRLDAKNTFTLRGLSSSTMRLDGFLPPPKPFRGNTLNFNIERVDVIRGPQSLMYGNGSPGGVLNMTSKQARFGQRPKLSVQLQTDRWGSHMAQADFSAGDDKVALRVVGLYQEMWGYRDFIGGSAQGAYGQLAVKPLKNTTLRFSGMYTHSTRMFDAGNQRLNSGSTALDGRHNLMLNYIVWSDQVMASDTGASGAGPILNGNLGWHNTYSMMTDWRSEQVTIKSGILDVETKWNDWLDTKLSIGETNEDFPRHGVTGRVFHSPISPTNPFPGHWTQTQNNAAIPQSLYQESPTRVRGVRLAAVITNRDLFGGRASSQTLLGADFVRTDSDIISGSYFLADANWNPVINQAQINNQFGGRTQVPNFSWIVDFGPVRHPVFKPGIDRFTLNGQNYIRMDQNPGDPSKVTPDNPLGVFIGGASQSLTDTEEKGVYAVNLTDWYDGKLNTLMGIRYGGIEQTTLNQTGGPQIRNAPDAVSFNAGVNYRLSNWLIPYYGISSSKGVGTGRSTDGSGLTNNDPLGVPPEGVSEALGHEIGLKVANRSGTVSGSLAMYSVVSSNDSFAVNGNLATAINPTGLNGDHGFRGSRVVVDRKSTGIEAVVTAIPVKNWRLRFSGAIAKGRIDTPTSYQQVYNDQFRANASGQVLYADGSLLYVTPTFSANAPIPTASTPGAVPLTITMMNTVGNTYYANPNAVNGHIAANSVLATVLTRTDPVRGNALTGATGLPISAMQINPGFTLPGTIETTRSGDRTAGYPELSANLTNAYDFTEGRLKGLSVGTTVISAWRRNMFNYFVATPAPGVDRVLFRRPNTFRVDAMVRYKKRFERFDWSIQLNVNNIFDRWEGILIPNPTTGFSNRNNLDATVVEEPRNWIVTTNFDF